MKETLLNLEKSGFVLISSFEEEDWCSLELRIV